jgi:tetratricopeptide (TPR) repeat protein
VIGAGIFAVLIGDLVLEAFHPVDADGPVGYGVRRFSALEYARTQPGVVLHYLRLAFWPHPLCLDYWWPPARAWHEFVPQTLVVATLLAATLVLVARRSVLGFLGAWFFVILAPTSSVVPIQDAAFEHRMYLSLAAVVLAVVLGAARLSGRCFPGRAAFPAVLLAVAVPCLGALTIRRNQDYRSAVRMWETVVARAPDNPRGHGNLGRAWMEQGDLARAIDCFERSLALRLSAKTLANLGTAHARLGDPAAAEGFYRRSLEVNPGLADVHFSLGNALRLQGRTDEAIHEYEKAARQDPSSEEALVNLGSCLLASGRAEEALERFQQALLLPPSTVLENLQAARALLVLGRPAEALARAERASALAQQQNPDVLETLAEACLAAGELERSAAALERALALVPDQRAGRVQRERLRARLVEVRGRIESP